MTCQLPTCQHADDASRDVTATCTMSWLVQDDIRRHLSRCASFALASQMLCRKKCRHVTKGHYSRSPHAHFSHTFYVVRHFPRTLHIFFCSQISLVTSVSTIHKNLWELTKKCVKRGLLTKKIAPSNKKSTEWSEWQEWYVLNSYELKHCAYLRTRPVHNLNSIWDTFVYQYWILFWIILH
jgi:hypothetical protein